MKPASMLMRQLGSCVIVSTLGYLLNACQREDGLPDPPAQMLVPCIPDAAPDTPLACPFPQVPISGGIQDMATPSD